MERALLVIQDVDLRDVVARALIDRGLSVATAPSVPTAMEVLVDDEEIDCLVVSIDTLGRTSGRRERSCTELREATDGGPFLLLASRGRLDEAVPLLERGVTEIAQLPIHEDVLWHRLATTSSGRRPSSRPIPRRKSDVILGTTPAMVGVRKRIGMLARADEPVAIYGESGTGKELAARMIHCESPRRTGPLVVTNCAAMPESLFENELFGHERGSYTGAHTRSLGLIEEARAGTLVLDEIGELSLPLQSKLLRLLQFGTYRRVGDTQTRTADVRVVCLTNRNLLAACAASTFRQDLYYRINVLHVTMPSLREHLGDVPLLVDHIVRHYCERRKRPLVSFSDDALALLKQHDWPGNVRELEGVLMSALALNSGQGVTASDLEFTPQHAGGAGPALPTEEPMLEVGVGLGEARDRLMASFERSYLLQLLQRTRGNVSAAAREAAMDRKSLWRLLKKHAIDASGYRG